jgi:hypothetical protein
MPNIPKTSEIERKGNTEDIFKEIAHNLFLVILSSRAGKPTSRRVHLSWGGVSEVVTRKPKVIPANTHAKKKMEIKRY